MRLDEWYFFSPFRRLVHVSGHPHWRHLSCNEHNTWTTLDVPLRGGCNGSRALSYVISLDL